MKPLTGILVIAVWITAACTPSQQAPSAVETTPVAHDSEAIKEMDFEEGEIEPGQTFAATPVPESGEDDPES